MKLSWNKLAGPGVAAGSMALVLRAAGLRDPQRPELRAHLPRPGAGLLRAVATRQALARRREGREVVYSRTAAGDALAST